MTLALQGSDAAHVLQSTQQRTLPDAHCVIPMGWSEIAARKTRYIVFGGLHGTREGLEFIARLSCGLARTGKRLLVAIGGGGKPRIVRMLALFVLTAAVPAYAGPNTSDPLERFRCNSAEPIEWANWQATRAAYLQQSVGIIAASLSGDLGILRAAVAHDARPVRFYFDAGFVNSTGPVGVAQVFRSIAPVSFELVQERGLPPPTTHPCREMEVNLTLKGSNPNEAYVARLKYKNGLLTDLVVQDADYVAGKFSKIRRD